MMPNILKEIKFDKIEWKKAIGDISERKTNKCVIEFENNPAKVYYTGQLICGYIYLSLNEKRNVRGICVKIIGKAYVRWSEEYGENPSVYTGKEIFFDERIDLDGESNNKINLMPGCAYKYTFQYKLPDFLPSSIESRYGNIRYKACVVLDTLLCSNDEFANLFTVISVVNLPPNSFEPITSRHHKKFYLLSYMCCFLSEPLETVARISRNGYIPNQTIDLHLHIKNKSNQPVLELTVLFIQKIKYLTHVKNSDKKTEEIILRQEYIRGCESGQEQDSHIPILVPTVPPNQDAICNIIKVKYFIRILVSVPCGHSDPEINLPIFIGSAPIKDKPPLPEWINPIAYEFE